MSVMGFKKSWMGWVVFLDFWKNFNFAKPLTSMVFRIEWSSVITHRKNMQHAKTSVEQVFNSEDRLAEPNFEFILTEIQ